MKSQPFQIIGKYRFGWVLLWALMIMLVFSLVMGLNESIRNFPFSWMAAFGLTAVFAGWIFGGSQRRKFVALVCGLLLGVIMLAFVNSGGYQNLFQAFVEGFKSIQIALPYQPQFKETQSILFLLSSLMGALGNFFNQSLSWMQNLFQESNNFNPIITRTLWGSLLWSASFSTGWMLRRRYHALIASLPILVLLTGILGYTRQNTTGLVMALFSLLMMIVLLEHLSLEDKWQKIQYDFSEEIRFDIVLLGIPTIITIMIIAIVLPNIPYDKIREIYNQNLFPQEREQVNIDKSLGLQKTPGIQTANRQTGGLPRSFLIGTGPELSENLVMEIDTGEVFLPPEIDPEAERPKYYWFGRSYDIYTGNGWETSEVSLKNYSINETIVPADTNTTRILRQKINKSANASSTLYSSGIPQSVDHRVTVGWRNATGEYYSSQIDGLAYQVESPVLEIPIESLHQADQEPPDEIVENYLQINEEIPQRVLDLATSITQDAIGPYEKANAIETYLRQFEYTLDIPAPPDNSDIVDYFLFDLQKGYCDYFASTMVILSRAVDLPARLAVGYSTGRYEYQRQVFVVTEANAHAWPEIYIAPYGWIPFEPTTSLGTFNWETDLERQGEHENLTLPEPSELNGNPYWPDMLVLAAALLLFVFVFFFSNKIFKSKTQGLPTPQQIERIHQKTKKHLKQLFFSPQSAKTPLEFQNTFIEWLNQQNSSRITDWLIGKIKKNLLTITALYHQGIYTPRPLSKTQINAARQDLTRLVTHAWILYAVLIIKR